MILIVSYNSDVPWEPICSLARRAVVLRSEFKDKAYPPPPGLDLVLFLTFEAALSRLHTWPG